jgi:ribose transport system substrate-binding protein
MRLQRVLPPGLVLAVSWLLLGCGKQENHSAPGTEGKNRGTIGVSVMTLNNPFFKVIGDTITAEAGKHGYRVLVVDGREDSAAQEAQVRDFIVKKVRAIVLCPCKAREVGTAIKEASEAGIPVFTADTACLAPDAKVVTHVATDNLEGGRMAARAMIEALGEAGGKILILDYKSAESCLLRVKGFKEVIDKHNSAKPGKVAIVAELPGGGDKAKGQQAAEDALTRYPDLAGIFAINDPSALGARAALERAGQADRVKLVGFDGQPEGKQAIRDGKIYADPIQFPERIGRETVKAIIRHFEGENVPAQILIPTALYRKADALKELK